MHNLGAAMMLSLHAWALLRLPGQQGLTRMNSSKAMRLSLLESTFSMTFRISALLTLRPSPSASVARLFSSTSISRESRLPLPLLSTYRDACSYVSLLMQSGQIRAKAWHCKPDKHAASACLTLRVCLGTLAQYSAQVAQHQRLARWAECMRSEHCIYLCHCLYTEVGLVEHSPSEVLDGTGPQRG